MARLVDELDDVPMPEGTLLNVNGPPGEVKGARACRLGKRVYNDKMELTEEGERGRRRYRLYGEEPSYEHEAGHRLRGDRRGPDRGHARSTST